MQWSVCHKDSYHYLYLAAIWQFMLQKPCSCLIFFDSKKYSAKVDKKKMDEQRLMWDMCRLLEILVVSGDCQWNKLKHFSIEK